MGWDAGRVLCQVGLIFEKPGVRQHKSECHQCDASANPCEKCSLFGEIISQVSRWLSFDRGNHFRLHRGINFRVHIIGWAGKTLAIQLTAEPTAARIRGPLHVGVGMAVRLTLVHGAGGGADACRSECVARRGGGSRNGGQSDRGREDESDETHGNTSPCLMGGFTNLHEPTWRRTIDPSKVVAAAVARVRIRIDIGVLRHQG
jgi:hypothetical protein